jgi:hypothetical protein
MDLKIQKLMHAKPEHGKSIIYHFPEIAVKLMDNYIQVNTDTNCFYNIELEPNEGGYKIYLRKTNNAVLSDTTSQQGLLLSSCSRFCKIGDRMIPIYLSSDKEFGFYNFVITGTELIINLRRKSYHIFEVIEYHENR